MVAVLPLPRSRMKASNKNILLHLALNLSVNCRNSETYGGVIGDRR